MNRNEELLTALVKMLDELVDAMHKLNAIVDPNANYARRGKQEESLRATMAAVQVGADAIKGAIVAQNPYLVSGVQS